MDENFEKKGYSVSFIVSMIILLLGAAVLAVGIILWKTNGIDQYIHLESFSVKDQPLDNIAKLDINVESGTLKIIRGGEKLDLNAENVPEGIYDYGTRDGKFVLKCKSRFSFLNYSVLQLFTDKNIKPKFELTLPDKVFDEVTLKVGAGEIELDGLTADEIEIDVGAGSLSGSGVKALNELNCDIGAGEFVLTDCETSKLELDCGAGSATYKGTVTGGADIDCGVGELNITVYGSADMYNIKAEKGIGDLNIDRGGAPAEKGSIPFKVDGGIGEINIKFVNQ